MLVDVSRTQELQTQLNRSKQDLETAYEERQSTNEELETTNEEAFNGGDFSEVIVPATNRRGKAIACKVTATPLLGAHKEVRGVILMMEEQIAAGRPH